MTDPLAATYRGIRCADCGQPVPPGVSLREHGRECPGEPVSGSATAAIDRVVRG